MHSDIGAPVFILAKEREGAPPLFPHKSCPFQTFFHYLFFSGSTSVQCLLFKAYNRAHTLARLLSS